MNQQTTCRYAVALTIAGSDSGGGAGIQADIKTFSSLGVYGASVVTAITAQNTVGVRAIEAVSAGMLRAQLMAVFDDLPVDAIKIGMLHTAEAVGVVADVLSGLPTCPPVVFDPVMLSTTGSRLTGDAAAERMARDLFPLATLLTPNLPEAGHLSGIGVDTEEGMAEAAQRLLSLGCGAVLIKGGHLPGKRMTDRLYTPGREAVRFHADAVDTRNTHGTGCTLSSAIAAHLALGHPLDRAVGLAKEYVGQALAGGADIRMGRGQGPMNHLFHPLALHKIKIDG